MKKIFKYSIIVSLCAALVSLTGCQKKEVDVDPMGGDFAFSGMAPNPVMRGGALRIYGRNLDQVSAVNFAGDIEVTEFVKLSKGAKLDTLEVIVPLEGPEVGKVVLNVKDGRKFTSFSDLSYSEPIEVESIAPKTVLSGDVLTIKGEYLNDVKEVIFSGEDAYAVDFESQSRHELKVVVPANAITGPVILSDVNEVTDASSIPNHIYTEDLTVGDPTVTKAAKATYKSGDVITVSGAHLDMIANVAVPQVAEVAFTVAEDGKTITFNLPAKASDGNIVLTSFAGKEFEAGEIETVTVKALTVKTLAEDGRYKAGCKVEIGGSDLDLVTKVEFTGAEAEWSLSEGKIVTVLPASAKDGEVTVTLESGKQAFSEEIEVVKPEILAWEILDAYVAGKTDVVVEGNDLDLVESVKMGDKEQGFIACDFAVSSNEAQELVIKVSIPEQAYTGPIIFTSAAGYETATDPITVTYDMAVSISFDKASYGLGENITISGKNLLKIEQIYIKGKKVTDFGVRADNAMSFGIPEGLGPGFYRLALVLTDGTEMTWPFPLKITAPYVETTIWEGSSTVTWDGGAVTALSWGGFDWSTVTEGMVLAAYYTIDDPAGCIRFGNGNWASMPSLAGLAPDGNLPLQEGGYQFELTADDLKQLNENGGLVVCGTGFTITRISLIKFGAAEKRTTIWEGSSTVTWDGGAVDALSWGKYDWSAVTAGTKLSAVYTIDNPDGCIRFGNGNWASLPSLAGLAADGNLPLQDGGYTFELTEDDLKQLVENGGLVVCGTGFTITEIALVTTESAGPQETAIWEGSSTVTWDGGAVDALSWGKYDWSTVTASTILCAHYTIDDAEGCIRFGNGNWASLPSLAGLAADGNLPLQDGGYEFELTQADLDELVNNGGLVVCGTGYTITQIGLKK